MRTWHGCYDEGWGDLIVKEAFAHPAKYAYGLIKRIIEHGLERGYWAKGDLIGDPFGGIASGGIVAGYHGLHWLGVELEPRFHTLGNQNLARHCRQHADCGGSARLVQGDSRRFAEIVGEAAGIVTSPPYSESLQPTNNGIDWKKADPKWNTSVRKDTPGRKCIAEGYGQTPGNIGNLKSGSVDAVVTSPPYGETAVAKNSNGIDKTKQWETYRSHGGGVSKERFIAQQERHSGDYGSSVGQIGALRQGSVDAVVTSPPYAESVKGEHGETETAADSRDKRLTPGGSLGQSARHGGYGVTEGQIGALREGVDAVVTSPPYECFTANILPRSEDGKDNGAVATFRRTGKWPEQKEKTREKYGSSQGQLGNDTAETYWSAMRAVYEQCRLALKPGGVMAVVIKSYIKGGKLVDLPQQTWDLLLHLGFDPVERVRAMLVKEEKHPSLFGGEHTRKKERKSFFRRLAEKKGSPPIDFEEVLFVRRPDNQ